MSPIFGYGRGYIVNADFFINLKGGNLVMRSAKKNAWILLLLVICGVIIGGFLGELLGKYIPILKFGYNLGISPHTYDLRVIKLTFGLTFNINMFTILGIIIAIMFYKNM